MSWAGWRNPRLLHIHQKIPIQRNPNPNRVGGKVCFISQKMTSKNEPNSLVGKTSPQKMCYVQTYLLFIPLERKNVKPSTGVTSYWALVLLTHFKQWPSYNCWLKQPTWEHMLLKIGNHFPTVSGPKKTRWFHRWKPASRSIPKNEWSNLKAFFSLKLTAKKPLEIGRNIRKHVFF